MEAYKRADEQEPVEAGIRQAMLSTTGTGVGALGVSYLLTTFLPTTLEDLLALAFGGVVAYLSVLTLPVRLQGVKQQIAEKTRTLS